MANISVTTRSFNNRRDGCNSNESRLTSTYVQSNGIKHLFDINLDDGLRGTEGMPLVAAGLTMRDNLVHDVLFSADMSNNVYAFDANTGQKLWKQHIGNPITGNRKIDMYLLNDKWGILSTPCINLATKSLFVVKMTSPDGLIGDSSFYLHALSLIDGSDQAPPLLLNSATYKAPGLDRVSKLGNVPRKQRCGLLFDSRNGVDTVFVANGSFMESADTNQGWLIACDVTNLKLNVAAAWTTTSRYSGGGLWMGGQGPSMDDKGFIYAMVGNGSFDGITDFGESFVKLQYTPKTSTSAAAIKIVDWWSPFNDVGRVYGAAAQGYADDSIVPNSIKNSTANDDKPGATSNMDSAGDEDLNSGGPLLLTRSITGFSKDVIIGAGKDGIAYILDMNNMGKTKLSDFASPAGVAANFSKLLSPPYGFTYYPAGIDLMSPDFSVIPTTMYGYTHHQHSTSIAYKSPDHGFMIFTWGENSPVRAFTLNSDFTLSYVASGDIIASAQCKPPGGMPGGMMTLSCSGQGTNTAVLWASVPYGDANKTITDGRLVAYGANWDNNGQLIKIWDSQDWGITFKHNKFNIPACINGKVYLPTYDSRIMVFG